MKKIVVILTTLCFCTQSYFDVGAIGFPFGKKKEAQQQAPEEKKPSAFQRFKSKVTGKPLATQSNMPATEEEVPPPPPTDPHSDELASEEAAAVEEAATTTTIGTKIGKKIDSGVGAVKGAAGVVREAATTVGTKTLSLKEKIAAKASAAKQAISSKASEFKSKFKKDSAVTEVAAEGTTEESSEVSEVAQVSGGKPSVGTKIGQKIDAGLGQLGKAKTAVTGAFKPSPLKAQADKEKQELTVAFNEASVSFASDVVVTAKRLLDPLVPSSDFESTITNDIGAFVENNLIPSLIDYLNRRGVFIEEFMLGEILGFKAFEFASNVAKKVTAGAKGVAAKTFVSKVNVTRSKIRMAILEEGNKLIGDKLVPKLQNFLSNKYPTAGENESLANQLEKIVYMFWEEAIKEIESFATSESVKMVDFVGDPK